MRVQSALDLAKATDCLGSVGRPYHAGVLSLEHIQGVVRARVLVGSDGTVKKVKIITGLPYGLSYQAMDAAYQLIFRPATVNGQPVAYWMSVLIEFNLK